MSIIRRVVVFFGDKGFAVHHDRDKDAWFTKIPTGNPWSVNAMYTVFPWSEFKHVFGHGAGKESWEPGRDKAFFYSGEDVGIDGIGKRPRIQTKDGVEVDLWALYLWCTQS